MLLVLKTVWYVDASTGSLSDLFSFLFVIACVKSRGRGLSEQSAAEQSGDAKPMLVPPPHVASQPTCRSFGL